VLFHRYAIDAEGLITSARIVPPTSQNQASIEDDLRRFVAGRLDLDDEQLTRQCEQAIRTTTRASPARVPGPVMGHGGAEFGQTVLVGQLTVPAGQFGSGAGPTRRQRQDRHEPLAARAAAA
jgi:hypothetical protein